MEEQTTTEATTQAEGVQETQPTQEQQTEAVENQEQQPSNQQEDGPAEGADNPDDWKGWLETKGIDPSDPEAVAKVASMARNAEKESTKRFQEASEIKKQLESQKPNQVSQDPLTQQLYEEVVAMKRNSSVNDFKRSKNITADQESKMVEYLSSNPHKVEMVNAGYMTLDEVYMLSGAGALDTTKLKSEGGKEALEQLASKQRTTAPNGQARTPYAKAGKDDPFLKGFESD